MTDIPETLLPCPFCGGEAEIERHGTARQSMIVACQHCGARMESGDVSGLTRDLAWNRRAAQAERMARLEEALRRLLKCEYDGQGLTDCIDNDGCHYPSQELADAIANAESVVPARALSQEGSNA